ncbi:hypothetical protein AGMMS49944_14040 [Spirochaetia bacterium]|nr:hypothetical protein AGMMS49944_14040 [Spirochaetia bacterium]
MKNDWSRYIEYVYSPEETSEVLHLAWELFELLEKAEKKKAIPEGYAGYHVCNLIKFIQCAVKFQNTGGPFLQTKKETASEPVTKHASFTPSAIASI